MGKTADPLEAVIRPIIEGQIRSFTFDHPEVVAAVDWFKPRKDKRQTFINSVAKRIIRDLLGAGNRARLVEAIAAIPRGMAHESALQPSGGALQMDAPSLPSGAECGEIRFRTGGRGFITPPVSAPTTGE